MYRIQERLKGLSTGEHLCAQILLPTNARSGKKLADVFVHPTSQRRVRETPTVRQAFHRFPSQGGVRGCIIEVVENAQVERPELWGLVVNVFDLDAFVATAGDLVGTPNAAVQPGRRIVTVRRSAGLGTAVAVMSTEGD